MENTLIITANNINHPSEQLNRRQSIMLDTAGLLDILTESCRLAECNPEMKIVFYHPDADKENFLQNFSNNLQSANLTVDKHFTNFFNKKIEYHSFDFLPYGEVLTSALLRETADEDTENVILVRCLCPMLIGEMLDDAFYYLSESDLVLGGTKSGELYLLGLHKFDRQFFQQIDLASDSAYTDLFAAAQNAGLETDKMDILESVNQKQDMKKLYEKLCQNGFAPNTKTILEKIL